MEIFIISAFIKIESATQSSTYKSKAASYAIDGDNTTISHTEDQHETHWLKLYLGGRYTISRVTVVNRVDSCCMQRITGKVVILYDGSTETARSQPIQATTEKSIAAQTNVIEFNDIVATTVKIVHNNTGSSLNIGEVYVESTEGL